MLCGMASSMWLSPARAQVPPVCSGAQGGVIYYTPQNTDTIYVYNPALPTSTTNPSATSFKLPAGSDKGLAICPNVNSATPSPTFYTVLNGTFRYWNGTSWINTGHNSGSTAAANLTGGGGYIYALDVLNGQVFRYDGSGNATLVLNNFGFHLASGLGGASDLAADCSGNFYVLKTAGTPYTLRKYSPNGALLQTWSVTGTPATGAGGGGLAIIGNQVYFDWYNVATQAGSLFIGTLGITSVNFTNTPFPAFYFPFDFASCPIGSNGNYTVQASIDTGYYCGSGPGIPITGTGASLYTWTVLSGPAVITGSGSSVTLTASGTSRIRVYGTDPGIGCGGDDDTVTVIVPTANVDAGPPSTSAGCGVYTDTLAGTLTGTTPGITYNIAWAPASSVVSGLNTLTPIVSPTTTTTYTLSVSTPPAQGGCVFRDSVVVTALTVSVNAAFSNSIRYGCKADTVTFTNTSATSQGTMWYEWDFGDGATSNLASPVHIYTTAGTYTVRLIARNGNCSDTAYTTIPINNFLDAGFLTLPNDSLCGADTVQFANTTAAITNNGIAPRYLWSFGDGSFDTAFSPRHYYPVGAYVVTLSVRDFVPCADTARDTIVVDPVPSAQLSLSDTLLCVGDAISLSGEASSAGSTGLVWTFGDGVVNSSNTATLTHGYDQAGLYVVTLYATYRICPDTTDTVQVRVLPFPRVNVGEDTSLCPGGEPQVLTARVSEVGAPGSAQIVWSTGDTASSILVRHPGLYWARVTGGGGCASSDSMVVNKGCYLDIPNTFTPNGDGVNDYFLPRLMLSDGVTRFSMVVYNRWGQKIWETARIDGRGWDGRFNGQEQPIGAYVYLIEVELANNKRERYQGNVTLLR